MYVLFEVHFLLCHLIRNEVMINSDSESAICALNKFNMYSLYNNSQFKPPVEICSVKSVFARLR